MPDHSDMRTLDRQMRAARAKLDNFAMMVAIAGSIANALERGGACSQDFPAVSAYLPSPDTITAARQLLGSREPAVSQLAAALDALQTRAVFARDLANAAIKSGTGDLDAAPVADSVRRLASLCFVVRNAMDLTNKSAPTDGQRTVQRELDAILRRVSSGQMPCLNEMGQISVPGWAERRQIERQHAQLAVIIEHRGRRVRGKLVNASPTGLGVSGLNNVHLNDTVTVHLPGGKICPGRAAWVGPGRAGIALNRALPPETLRTLVTGAEGDAP